MVSKSYWRSRFGTQKRPWASQCRYLKALRMSPTSPGGTSECAFQASRMSSESETLCRFSLWSDWKARETGSFFLA